MNFLKSFTFRFIWIIVFFLLIPEVQGQKGVFEYTVRPINNLDFGTFSIGQLQAGTVTVDLSNNGTEGGSAKLVPFGSQPLTGSFEIEVTKGTRLITLSSPTAPSELTGPSTSKLFVDNLIFDQNPIYVDKNDPLPTVINMGGRLTIPAGSPTESYSGTIYVIFNYD